MATYDCQQKRTKENEALRRYLCILNDRERAMEEDNLSLLKNMEKMDLRIESMSLKMDKLKILKEQYFLAIKEQFQTDTRNKLYQKRASLLSTSDDAILTTFSKPISFSGINLDDAPNNEIPNMRQNIEHPRPSYIGNDDTLYKTATTNKRPSIPSTEHYQVLKTNSDQQISQHIEAEDSSFGSSSFHHLLTAVHKNISNNGDVSAPTANPSVVPKKTDIHDRTFVVQSDDSDSDLKQNEFEPSSQNTELRTNLSENLVPHNMPIPVKEVQSRRQSGSKVEDIPKSSPLSTESSTDLRETKSKRTENVKNSKSHTVNTLSVNERTVGHSALSDHKETIKLELNNEDKNEGEEIGQKAVKSVDTAKNRRKSSTAISLNKRKLPLDAGLNVSSHIDSDDSFNEKEYPLTSSAAYRSLIGGGPVAQKVQKNLTSSSESEDDVERAVLMAMKAKAEANVQESSERLEQSASKIEKNVDFKQGEENMENPKEATSAPPVKFKFSKASKIALNLKSDSDGEPEKEDKDEDSDEFAFFD